ncbi:response regulator transcription factor [Flavisolibacter sp. BT320]|nr:response regulator transcription factor [Flavisolibacter longurius]
MDICSKPLRVIIADDHPLYRAGLKQLLTAQKHIQLIAEAKDGRVLCELVQQYTPDVVVTDISMPVLNGVEATKWIKATYPQTGVVALSMFGEAGMIKEMLLAGAGAYLKKEEAVTTVSDAIYTVSSGQFYFSTTLSHYLSGVIHPAEARCSLTKREMEILQHIFDELTSKQIGEKLHLSERTIEDHRKHIQQKTGAKNVVGLIKYALLNKIVKLKEQ